MFPGQSGDRGHDLIYILQRVVNVWAEADSGKHSLPTGCSDQVFVVQARESLDGIDMGQREYQDSGTPGLGGRSIDRHTRKFPNFIFQNTAQLADAPLDALLSNVTMELDCLGESRERSVIALAQPLKFLNRMQRIGCPTRTHDGRPDVVHALLSNIEHTGFLGYHQPLMSTAGVKVATHSVQIYLEGTKALGAVDQSQDTPLSCDSTEILDGQSHSGDVGDMTDGQYSCFSAESLDERGQQLVLVMRRGSTRYALDAKAVSLSLDIPGHVVAGMILVPENDFVPWL